MGVENETVLVHQTETEIVKMLYKQWQCLTDISANNIGRVHLQNRYLCFYLFSSIMFFFFRCPPDNINQNGWLVLISKKIIFINNLFCPQ